MKILTIAVIVLGSLSIHAMDQEDRKNGGHQTAPKKLEEINSNSIVLPNGAELIRLWIQQREERKLKKNNSLCSHMGC